MTSAHWPDGSRCETDGNVLFWSAEEDAADTIVPRLMAAAADLSRVHIIKGKMLASGQAMPFDPADDVPELHRRIECIGGVALLIVDPIVSAVSGDMHELKAAYLELSKSTPGMVRYEELIATRVDEG